MRIPIILLLWLLLSCCPAWAMERFEIITTQQLEQMLAEREAGRINFLLVNSLDKLIADSIAIPGSVNVPWAEIHEKANLLGEDKDRLIVIY